VKNEKSVCSLRLKEISIKDMRSFSIIGVLNDISIVNKDSLR